MIWTLDIYELCSFNIEGSHDETAARYEQAVEFGTEKAVVSAVNIEVEEKAAIAPNEQAVATRSRLEEEIFVGRVGRLEMVYILDSSCID